MAQQKILWLTPFKFSTAMRSLCEKFLASAKIDPRYVRFRCFTENTVKYQGNAKKKKVVIDESKRDRFFAMVKHEDADFIVINDVAALYFITGKYKSLAQTRGSIYTFQGRRCLVVDNITKTRSTDIGTWITKTDFGKLRRWTNGAQRPEPKFAYTVLETPAEVTRFVEEAASATVMSTDIETGGSAGFVYITCIGYTVLWPSGKMHSYVIPFYDGSTPDGCWWQNELDEIVVWEAIRELHANDVPKVLQNGTYDATHLITYRAPYHNYCLDTLHLFHSIWAESPKRLDFISSLLLDFYCFWKDEGKEDQKDDDQNVKVPHTQEGMRGYWMYNALDCHNTLLNVLVLVKLVMTPQFGLSWAIKNYRTEFRQQTGPLLAASMRGIKVNRKLQDHFNMSLTEEAAAALQCLHVMVDDHEFNPKSPPQVAHLLYDLLRAKELKRMGRSTDEKVLKLLQVQHPLLSKVIQQIWDVKKPANNASKYGAMPLMNGRFMYKVSLSATETGRSGSASSNWFIGTNAQNIPEPMRVMFEADPGWIMFDFDYSQSDNWFTAFSAESQGLMATMTSGKDTHLIHAAHFFQIPFEELVERKKAGDPIVAAKQVGIRDLTKRIVYGANYLMQGYTLYITMGHIAVVKAAEALGYEDAATWDMDKLVYLCQKFLDSYFVLYDDIKPFIEMEAAATKGRGGLAECYGDRTRYFFGDVVNDEAAKRELAAFFGQGGTAGNINAALDDYYYGTNLEASGDIMFFVPVHDSIVGQVRANRLDLLIELHRVMQRKCEYKGREFTVPVEGQVGFGWGSRMMKWRPDIPVSEIETHERNWWKEWTKKSIKQQ